MQKTHVKELGMGGAPGWGATYPAVGTIKMPVVGLPLKGSATISNVIQFYLFNQKDC